MDSRWKLIHLYKKIETFKIEDWKRYVCIIMIVMHLLKHNIDVEKYVWLLTR